jgi:hypothetical protein
MFDINELITRSKQYASKAGIAESTASFRIFGSGDQLKRLDDGKSCRVNTAKAAWKKLEQLEAKLSNEEAA